MTERRKEYQRKWRAANAEHLKAYHTQKHCSWSRSGSYGEHDASLVDMLRYVADIHNILDLHTVYMIELETWTSDKGKQELHHFLSHDPQTYVFGVNAQLLGPQASELIRNIVTGRLLELTEGGFRVHGKEQPFTVPAPRQPLPGDLFRYDGTNLILVGRLDT